MVAAAVQRFGAMRIIDDNHADALWLLEYAEKRLVPMVFVKEAKA